MKTNVLLRDNQNTVNVTIGKGSKPDIPPTILERWQVVINLVADLLEVPAGLIMQITDSHMEVFLKSDNEENPYPEDGKDDLLHGLYCETVIGTNDELHVDNSLKYDTWKDNPDVKLNMISYYGLPLTWGDGSVFGTICALDNKTNEFETKYRQLLKYFKEMIELDLRNIEAMKRLEEESGMDPLTGVANRRTLEKEAATLEEEYRRYQHNSAFILIDIDGFKEINDQHGHLVGDDILRQFAKLVSGRLRKVDLLARYGGDEFSLILKETKDGPIDQLMEDIRHMIRQDELLAQYDIDFSYGKAWFNSDHSTFRDVIKTADDNLYKNKYKK